MDTDQREVFAVYSVWETPEGWRYRREAEFRHEDDALRMENELAMALFDEDGFITTEIRKELQEE